MKEIRQKHYCNYKDKILKREREYRENNQKHISFLRRKKYKENYEKIKERQRKWVKNNQEWCKNYKKIYYQKHKEAFREKRNNWEKEKRTNDIGFRIAKNFSRLINLSLKGNKAGRKWEKLVGYTRQDLLKHLKATMPRGYEWKDYLDGKLHIDHIIPRSMFNYTSPEHIDFKRCWGLENLQLLPAMENLSKSTKLEQPFQTALRI